MSKNSFHRKSSSVTKVETAAFLAAAGLATKDRTRATRSVFSGPIASDCSLDRSVASRSLARRYRGRLSHRRSQNFGFSVRFSSIVTGSCGFTMSKDRSSRAILGASARAVRPGQRSTIIALLPSPGGASEVTRLGAGTGEACQETGGQSARRSPTRLRFPVRQECSSAAGQSTASSPFLPWSDFWRDRPRAMRHNQMTPRAEGESR